MLQKHQLHLPERKKRKFELVKMQYSRICVKLFRIEKVLRSLTNFGTSSRASEVFKGLLKNLKSKMKIIFDLRPEAELKNRRNYQLNSSG